MRAAVDDASGRRLAAGAGSAYDRVDLGVHKIKLAIDPKERCQEHGELFLPLCGCLGNELRGDCGGSHILGERDLQPPGLAVHVADFHTAFVVE